MLVLNDVKGVFEFCLDKCYKHIKKSLIYKFTHTIIVKLF